MRLGYIEALSAMQVTMQGRAERQGYSIEEYKRSYHRYDYYSYHHVYIHKTYFRHLANMLGIWADEFKKWYLGSTKLISQYNGIILLNRFIPFKNRNNKVGIRNLIVNKLCGS